MIDSDLRDWAGQAPDRELNGLEEQIWARVAALDRSRRVRSRLLAAQIVLLGVVFALSAIAGRHLAHPAPSSELSAFSPQMPLNASTLLVGNAR